MENIKEIPREVTFEHSIPIDILDDLCSRFIINVPEEERKDFVRICFQIELAHWFYLDFYCADNNEEIPCKLKPCGIKEFVTHIFQHIPALKQYTNNLDKIFESWREYKQAVPTFGAILLNQDLTHVLLVQSYWAKSSWGFPKGKINQDEEPSHCAVREVLEETGFDITNLIDPNEFIESTVNDQVLRLYIIGGIQQDTKFHPRTRNEIKAVEWFSMADLPASKKDMTTKAKIGVGPNAFFMVLPFVKKIRRWIAENQLKGSTVRRQRYKSMGDLELSCNVPNSKPKKQNQFSLSLQSDIEDFNKFQSQRAINACLSPPNQSRNGRKERKPCFKRKLFNNNSDAEKNKPRSNNGIKNVSPRTILANNFSCQSWLNFKFDRLAIMEAWT
uniref:m7GpppN-mRNA hydrolase n=1 Tax=Clastoptera arizonana TaxID=38151 RepID=A0A1B6E4F0_9HEMI